LGSNTKQWLAENATGGWTKIGGTPYKVVSGERAKTGSTFWGSDTHTDYAKLQDQGGNTLYLLDDGTISNTPPK
jgi:hypothetical protein